MAWQGPLKEGWDECDRYLCELGAAQNAMLIFGHYDVPVQPRPAPHPDQPICRRCKGIGSITDFGPTAGPYGADPRPCECWQCNGTGMA